MKQSILGSLKLQLTSRALRRPGFVIPSARYAKLPKFIMLNLRLKLLRSGLHVTNDHTWTNDQKLLVCPDFAKPMLIARPKREMPFETNSPNGNLHSLIELAFTPINEKKLLLIYEMPPTTENRYVVYRKDETENEYLRTTGFNWTEL